jgi:putative flippase GtrA
MNLVSLVEQRSPRLAAVIAMSSTRQLIRYIFAGFCVTQFAACVYSAAVLFLHMDALVANLFGTGCGLGAGYLTHSRWTFARGPSEGDSWQAGRFLVASLVAFVINTMWVWLLTKALRLPPLAPVPLMMLATPWISFLLNRYWVFKAA